MEDIGSVGSRRKTGITKNWLKPLSEHCVKPFSAPLHEPSVLMKTENLKYLRLTDTQTELPKKACQKKERQHQTTGREIKIRSTILSKDKWRVETKPQ